MSFTYKEVRRSVRFKERDNDEVRFSDFELKEAVNEVIRYLSNSNALTNADFNEKQVWYDSKNYHHGHLIEDYHCHRPDEQTNCSHTIPRHHDESFARHGVPFPNDFISIVAVKGFHGGEVLMEPCELVKTPNDCQYKVIGGKIYTGASNFCLIYKATMKEVIDEDDEIELPYIFKDHFVNLVRMVINQAEPDTMRAALEDAVDNLIPRRRYRNAKLAMPF